MSARARRRARAERRADGRAARAERDAERRADAPRRSSRRRRRADGPPPTGAEAYALAAAHRSYAADLLDAPAVKDAVSNSPLPATLLLPEKLEVKVDHALLRGGLGEQIEDGYVAFAFASRAGHFKANKILASYVVVMDVHGGVVAARPGEPYHVVGDDDGAGDESGAGARRRRPATTRRQLRGGAAAAAAAARASDEGRTPYMSHFEALKAYNSTTLLLARKALDPASYEAARAGRRPRPAAPGAAVELAHGRGGALLRARRRAEQPRPPVRRGRARAADQGGDVRSPAKARASSRVRRGRRRRGRRRRGDDASTPQRGAQLAARGAAAAARAAAPTRGLALPPAGAAASSSSFGGARSRPTSPAAGADFWGATLGAGGGLEHRRAERRRAASACRAAARARAGARGVGVVFALARATRAAATT